MNLALSLAPFGILWENIACTLLLIRSRQIDCQIPFIITPKRLSNAIWHWTRLCGGNSVKRETGPIHWTFWNITLLLTRFRQRDRQMPLLITRGYAEIQILKKICNSKTEMDCTTLKKSTEAEGWYLQDLAEEIARWHLSLVEANSAANSEKMKIAHNSQTVWNILINFCKEIDMEKTQQKILQNDIYHWSRLCRAPNSEKSDNGVRIEPVTVCRPGGRGSDRAYLFCEFWLGSQKRL